jgi:hypothetical protein
MAKFSNPYMGTSKLDFAADDPSLTDAITQMGIGDPD